MATKQFNSRIINKHDTEANWNLTSGFIPYAGETIVYDVDANHTLPRVKIGDGSTDVKLLPFIDAVVSVNNKTGVVTLTASDVGADPSGSASTVQDNLNTHTGNATVHTNSIEKSAWDSKYDKPSGGIPKTDLASGVQSSLDKADTALQSAPVTSVNSKTGAVTLSASDVLPEVTEADNGKVLGVVNGGYTLTDLGVGISYEVVTELPSTGEAGVIYLVANGGTGTNVYDEYIWTGSGYEKIGTTDIDSARLMPVVTSSDNNKVAKVVNGAWVAEENDFVVTFKKTNNVWSADKTINEITEAISAHKYVYATVRGQDVTSDSAIRAFSLLIPLSGTSLPGYVFSASFKSTGSKMIAVTLTYLMSSITLYTGEYSASAYIKPSDGIPSKDLASGVTDKLTEVIKYTIDPNTLNYVCDHTYAEIDAIIASEKPYQAYLIKNGYYKEQLYYIGIFQGTHCFSNFGQATNGDYYESTTITHSEFAISVVDTVQIAITGIDYDADTNYIQLRSPSGVISQAGINCIK